jgi:hypothetical protein
VLTVSQRNKLSDLNLLDPSAPHKTKNSFKTEKFAALVARVCPILLLFVTKKIILLHNRLFGRNPNYFLGKAWELKMVISHIFICSFDEIKLKSIRTV